MKHDHHQQQPVEAAPEEAVPALVEDPGGALLTGIEQEVLEAEMGEGEDEERHARQLA